MPDGIYQSTCYQSGASHQSVWISWTTSGTNALTGAQYYVWNAWQTAINAGTTAITVGNTGPAFQQRRYTPEQLAEIQRQNAAHQVQLDAEVAARAAAKARAKALLIALLSDAQRRDLDAKNYFEVTSSRGTRYRVYRGQAGNVVRLGTGEKEVERFCIHPRQHQVPDEDAMLIQKLMIETEEDRFIAVANKSRVA